MYNLSLRSVLIRPLLAFLLALGAPAHALDPGAGIRDYRHDRWSEADGAPSLIDAIAQTDDGWLWIASRRSGLYRFDGMRFTPFETADGSRLQHPSISVMQPGRGKTLWIGHGKGGVSVLRNNRLIHLLAAPTTGSVFAIAQGANETTWVASARGLFEVRDDKPVRVDARRGFDSPRSEYVMADSQGRVWASDGAWVYMLARGEGNFRRIRQVENDPMVVEAPDGSVWFVVGKRFERLAPAAAAAAPARRARANTYQSAFDADGNLWSGNCPVSVCVIRPAAWQDKDSFDALASREHLDQASQLTGRTVLSMLTDREGSLWIGTTAGLDRLRDQPVHMVEELFDVGVVQALPHPAGYKIALAAQRLNGESALWKLSGDSLVRLENPLQARVMGQAPDGSVVLAGLNGIERQYATRSERIPLPPIPAPSLKGLKFREVVPGNDEVWVSITGYGTWHYRQGAWTRFAPAGIANPTITIGPFGRTFISYRPDRLQILEAGRVVDVAAAPGVEIGDIQLIHVDKEVLVSGTRGYGILKNGRIESLRIAPELGIGIVSGIARSADGDYWLNSLRGVLRVKAADWARTMRDPAIPMEGKLFDALDGYTGGGDTIWVNNTAFMTEDHELWLAGERGLARLDLDALAPNPVAVDVEIMGLISAGRRFSLDRPIELGEGAQDLQIDYAYPSLLIPQRVRFRYRMLGLDEKWQDAGARRTAFYNNLAPGSYRFEVLAVNESGTPSRAPGVVRFTIAPRLTQTWWFYAICAVAGVGVLFLLYRIRMRHLAARLEERFTIRINERESIARGLHDTFLQSLQGLLFSMQAVVTKLPANTATRLEFDSLLERARSVLVEGRDEVKGLRSEFASSAEFWQVLMRDVGLIVSDGPGRVRIEGGDAVDRLQRRLHHNVHAIVREAVFNALRHTQGGVEVSSFADTKGFVLSIKDHGKGLGEFRGGKPGHYGLQGMFERAAQIGARLQFVDVPGGGTQVVLSIPASLAYADNALMDTVLQ